MAFRDSTGNQVWILLFKSVSTASLAKAKKSKKIDEVFLVTINA